MGAAEHAHAHTWAGVQQELMAGPDGYRDRIEGPGDGLPPRPGSSGERSIQRRLGTTEQADRFYAEQMLDHLNERMRDFVRGREMLFLSTADRDGRCDSTFRAGPPGFLQVLDERTLAYPEHRGNGIHASLGNILENPHLGILLIDFAQARIGLRINGRARVVEDADLRADHPGLPHDPVPGQRVDLWVRVAVEEAFIHCAEHIPQLRKAAGPAGHDWGMDDYGRGDDDFFGVARDLREAERVREGPAVGEPVRAAGPEDADAPGRAAERQRAALEPASERGQGRSAAPAPRVPIPSTSLPPGSIPPVPTVPPRPVSPPAAPPALPARVPVAALAAGPDPVAWRREAERALAEALRRGAAAKDEGSTPFQGWFG